MSNFDAVQAAALNRGAAALNSQAFAQQIVTAAQGDARLAYEFLDTLNRHVTKLLQEKKG
jgi:hypothetical protein